MNDYRKLRFTMAALAVATGACLFANGCGTKPAAPDKQAHDEHGDHEHDHEGPHGGHIIELGTSDYHAELVDDHDKHVVTVYILDGKAKNAAAIDAEEVTLNLVVNKKPQQYTLQAKPAPGDGEGKASRFELSDETLCDALDDKATTGRLSLTIAGKSYSGNISGHSH